MSDLPSEDYDQYFDDDIDWDAVGIAVDKASAKYEDEEKLARPVPFEHKEDDESGGETDSTNDDLTQTDLYDGDEPEPVEPEHDLTQPASARDADTDEVRGARPKTAEAREASTPRSSGTHEPFDAPVLREAGTEPDEGTVRDRLRESDYTDDMKLSKHELRDELIALEDASPDVRSLFRSRETTVSPLLYLSVDKFAEFVWTIGDDEGTCSIFGCRINEIAIYGFIVDLEIKDDCFVVFLYSYNARVKGKDLCKVRHYPHTSMDVAVRDYDGITLGMPVAFHGTVAVESSLADGTLLVMEAREPPRPLRERIIEQLAAHSDQQFRFVSLYHLQMRTLFLEATLPLLETQHQHSRSGPRETWKEVTKETTSAVATVLRVLICKRQRGRVSGSARAITVLQAAEGTLVSRDLWYPGVIAAGVTQLIDENAIAEHMDDAGELRWNAHY